MANEVTIQAVLDEIKGLGARLESGLSGLRISMSGLEASMSGLETGVSGLETRISGLETRVSGLETRMSGLETRMSGMETRMSGLETRMSGLEKRMSTIEDVVAELNLQIKTWPDLHYLASAAKLQLGHARETKADVKDLRNRMDEIYRTMATDPEVQNLRDDVSRFRDKSLENEVRLGATESRLGIRNSMEPR